MGMPWINCAAKFKLEDSKFFKWLQETDNERHSILLGLYMRARKLFPLYMLPRFYTMEIHPEAGGVDIKWAQVTHFLLLMARNEFKAWHHMYTEKGVCPCCNKIDANIYSGYTLTMDLHGKIEGFCKAAKDFLLEPWILVQLPFKPVLLHQWLVAALAEALKFETQVIPFFKLKVPAFYEDTLLELGNHLKILKRSVSAGFKHLACMYDPDKPYVVLSSKPDELLCKAIEEMLPVLEFVLGKEASNMIKALKKKIWSGAKSDNGDFIHIKISEEDKAPVFVHHVYELGFWLGSGQWEALFGKQRQVRYCRFPDWLNHTVDKAFEGKSITEINADIAQFLKLGSYKHHVPLVIDAKSMPKVQFYSTERLVYKEYVFLEGLALSTGVRQKDNSAVFQILQLAAESRMAEAACDLLQYYQKSTKLSLKSVYTHLNEVDQKEIKTAFEKARKGDGKWKFCTILEGLSEKLNKPAEPLQSKSQLEIVPILELKIKKLALEMAKCCFSQGPLDRRLLDILEWDMVQYVLPCLVCSLEKTLKDFKVKEEVKKWLQKFVVGLIETYEGSNCYTFQPYKANDVSDAFFHGELSPYNNLADEWSRVMLTIPFESVRIALAGLDKFVCQMCEIRLLGHQFQCAWRIIWRVRHVVDMVQEEEPPNVGEKLKQLMVATRAITLDTYLSLLKPEELPDNAIKIAAQIFRICTLMFHKINFERLRQAKLALPDDMQARFEEEAQSLSKPQLFRVMYYLLLNYSCYDDACVNVALGQIPLPSPHDLVHQAIFWHRAQDRWRLRQIISGWLKSDGEDLGMVSFNFAWETTPACYSIILQDIDLETKKLKMRRPGELTFCPIEHCRWCGLVGCEVFRTCSLCEDDPGYNDTNIFCSESCETEALEKQHGEEHARATMIVCGLSD